jgi:hypothetical protein
VAEVTVAIVLEGHDGVLEDHDGGHDLRRLPPFDLPAQMPEVKRGATMAEILRQGSPGAEVRRLQKNLPPSAANTA